MCFASAPPAHSQTSSVVCFIRCLLHRLSRSSSPSCQPSSSLQVRDSALWSLILASFGCCWVKHTLNLCQKYLLEQTSVSGVGTTENLLCQKRKIHHVFHSWLHVFVSSSLLSSPLLLYSFFQCLMSLSPPVFCSLMLSLLFSLFLFLRPLLISSFTSSRHQTTSNLFACSFLLFLFFLRFDLSFCSSSTLYP